MVPTAYNIVLMVGVLINGYFGLLLFLQAYMEHRHASYRRALMLSGIVLWIYAVGFWLYLHFQWRTVAPALASALTLTYVHMSGVLFSWSHTGLVDHSYPSAKIYVRDVLILAFAVAGYWLPDSLAALRIVAYVLCLLHCTWLVFTFYRKYYSMRQNLHRATDDDSISRQVNFIVLSCHMIVAMGIGCIIVTALTPKVEWPFTILLAAGVIVFVYIALTLMMYQDVVEATDSVIEDVTLMKHDPAYARFIDNIIDGPHFSNRHQGEG